MPDEYGNLKRISVPAAAWERIFGQPEKTSADRIEVFWTCVDKSAGCWLWRGGLNAHGYGQFRIDGRNQTAHRVAYELIVGPIPGGLHLDHVCRERRCVNPEHLEPVTPGENNRRSAAIRTCCPAGHPYTDENTYTRGGVRNKCRTCDRERTRLRRAAKHETRNRDNPPATP